MSFNYTSDLIQKAFTYTAYRKHIETELEKVIPADAKQQNLKDYTQKNIGLISRLDESIELASEIKEAVRKSPYVIWLVLTEGWCGDAAQSVPLMNKIAEESDGMIELRFLLRDSNPELMDQHLTNGGRSIPKIIVLDKGLEEIATWGPRPAALQQLIMEWRKEQDLPMPEFIKRLAGWYGEDKTLSTQAELTQLIKRCS